LMRPAEIDWLFSNRRGAISHALPEAWNAFCNAVNATDSSNPRDALHLYFDRLLGEDPVLRLGAARSWMAWEMAAFTSTNNSSDAAAPANNETIHAPVAVYKHAHHGANHSSEWSLRDGHDNAFSETSILVNATTVQETVFSLRQNLTHQVSLAGQQHRSASSMRPIRPVLNATTTVTQLTLSGDSNRNSSSSNNTASDGSKNATLLTPEQAARFVPSQNMLTCFYSVNDQYAMSDVNLLDTDRMERIQNIPCIAIQGGGDRICPVDTALDLLEQWPSMELRVPLQSGHSMYDVAITNELVCATDRMAHFLLTRRT
jgi:hypothetical protein